MKDCFLLSRKSGSSPAAAAVEKSSKLNKLISPSFFLAKKLPFVRRCHSFWCLETWLIARDFQLRKTGSPNPISVISSPRSQTLTCNTTLDSSGVRARSDLCDAIPHSSPVMFVRDKKRKKNFFISVFLHLQLLRELEETKKLFYY